METRLGVLPRNQAATWDGLEAGARRVDALGYDHPLAPSMADVLDDTFLAAMSAQVAELMLERKALGFHTFIAEMAAPFDGETLERWIGEVRPMVDTA
jgi:hypothetical protein